MGKMSCLKEKFNKRLWQDSSSEDSDPEDEEYYRVIRPRAPRHFRIRIDHFNQWNDEEFRIRFRLSKHTVILLEQKIRNEILPKTGRNQAVTAMQQILLLLRFCATGCMLQSIADFTGIHKSTACQIVKKVINAIVLLAPNYIKMPRSREEIDSTKRNFYKIAKFPRIIGAIDCTHIKIISPGGDNAEYFRNRKGYFSINVQVIGNSSLQINDIVTRWPGSTHDQSILNNSRMQARLESGEFGNGVLLGDSGYALKNYLITPILNPVTEAEQLFNQSQIRTRNPIERLFGIWKRRFPILSLGIRVSLDTAKLIIITCAVLHNIALNMNEPDPIQDPMINVDNEEIPENDFVNIYNHNNVREPFILYFMDLLQQNN